MSTLLQRALDASDTRALMEAMPERMRIALKYTWSAMARPSQLAPPGDWRNWLVLAGRGFGKTRCGAEWVRQMVQSGKAKRVALVAPTAADCRDVMVEGDSGIMSKAPPYFRPVYEPSKRRLTWPNGAQATMFSADEPDRLRGPNHDLAWADEICAWRYSEAWDMLQLTLRIGTNPQSCVTTTPRPTRLLAKLKADAATVVTGGTTFDNSANLSPQFLDALRKQYEGTRIGRQELLAEILEDVPGALWNRAQLDGLRVSSAPTEIARCVVGVDPAVTSGEDSDETGIIVAAKGTDGTIYVLDDATCRYSPDGWARRVVDMYHKHKADRIVAEVNNGGDLVQRVIRTVDNRVSYKAVHATKGKVTRAEPVAALYEQGKVRHVGTFAKLEDQMCSYTPDGFDGSPDRVDALVWAITELSFGPGIPGYNSPDHMGARRI